MYTTEIERFNSHLYFYYINNRIDPLAVIVDLSRVPPIIIEGQSYVELPKELQDRIKQIEGRKRAILSKSYQSDASYAAQPGRQKQSYLTRTESPSSLFQIRGKGKERMWLPAVPSFQRQGGAQGFRSHQGTTTQVGEVCSSVIWPPRFNSQIKRSFRRVQAFYNYIDRSRAPKS